MNRDFVSPQLARRWSSRLYVFLFGLVLLSSLKNVVDVHSSRRTMSQTEHILESAFEQFAPREVTMAQADGMMTTNEKSHYLAPSLPDISSIDNKASQFDVYWKRFEGDYETHNQTVGGKHIPGPFNNGSLYLLGARLTTSYETNDQSVFVTLFGMPGNLWSTVKGHEPRCKQNHIMGTNGTLLNYSDVMANVRIFCQLDCRHGLIPGRPVQMELIQTVSEDPLAMNATLMWHGNVTRSISRDDLRQLSQNELKVGVRFWISTRRKSHKPWSLRKDLASVEIPLTTGVVGQAGPQIRGKPIFSKTTLPLHASLCVATSGQDEIQLLPEFIQHHRNLGFEHVVIGVETHMGSTLLDHTKELLKRYLVEGTVTIAATGLHEFDCKADVQKNHFYNSCLYHSKGIAEYMAIWDVNEFWLPDTNFEFFTPPADLPLQALKFAADNNGKQRPEILTRDSMWNGSIYSVGPSIQDVTESIQAYQESHGCGEQWCFHGFPSNTVFLDPSSNDTYLESMTNHSSLAMENSSLPGRPLYITERFKKRDTRFDLRHSKSILKTKYTFMAGTHQPGSCRYRSSGSFRPKNKVSSTDRYYDTNSSGHCRNLRLNKKGSIEAPFGTMHHFSGLFRRKEGRESGSNESLPTDEYVRIYGKTVVKQLEAVYRNATAVE